MSSERERAVRELADRWNAGDIDGVLASMSPEVEMTPDPSFPDSDTMRGEKLRSWFEEWASTWKGNQLEVGEVTDHGAAMLARCRWHLRATEGGAEIPNREFSYVFWFDEENRPKRMMAFFDHQRALEEIEKAA